MKGNLLHILLSLLFSYSLCSQEIEVKPGDFLYGFSGGANFSRINVNRADEVKSAFGPFIGLSSSYIINRRLRGNVAGYFSLKSSIADTYFKVSQSGIDLQMYGQYKIDDLYLNFGLSSQTIVSFSSEYNGRSNFRLREEIKDYSTPRHTFDPLLGVEFKLMDNWKFFTNCTFSFNNNQRLYQFGLTYRINKRTKPGESEKGRRRRIANNQIRELRDGALLVRLKTAEPSVRAMEKRGFHAMAEATLEDQRVENLSIMKAFRAAYSFSELRFFYSSDSRKVLNGDFEGIFLNDSLERDSAIVLNSKKVFTCELTNIQEDTARYFSHYELVQTGNFAFKQVERYYGGGENTFYAFVVKDNKFNQLSRPFPYYSRALFKSLSEHPGHGLFYLPLKILFSDTPIGSVEDLNNKLFNYLEKVEKRYPED